jgi:hypothetical protein
MDKWHVWSCSCGAEQAMTKEAYRILKQSAATFYCVHGHTRWYPPGESEEDKLRRERDRLKQNEAWYEQRLKDVQAEAEHERRRANGYKGHATRITKRAKAGVCPCCNRTFRQLAAHMANKHPEFTPMQLEVIDGGKAQAVA